MVKFTLFCLGIFFYLSSQAQNDTTAVPTDTVFKRDSIIQKDTVVTVIQDTLQAAPKVGNPVYKLKPAIDIPFCVAGSAWTLYAFSKIYDRDESSAEKIQSLRTSNIPRFDRWAADIYSEKAAEASDVFFYGSMPLPVLLMFDKKVRRDAIKITVLYWEAMAVTGVLYSTSSILTSRYRPYAYNPEAPMSLRVRGGAKNSFYAGHVALVGTSTFFMAKVFADYHPDSKIKWIPYTLASIGTGATAYLRHRGGRHFPSDILLGTTLGPIVGILIPQFHKNKQVSESSLSIMPFAGSTNGLSLIYTFKKKKSGLLNTFSSSNNSYSLNSVYSCKGM